MTSASSNALQKIISGLVVVTAQSKSEKGGCTAAWYTRVSANPPMVLVCLTPKRHTVQVIKEANHFALNILAVDQADLAKHFGQKSGWKTDKYLGIAYSQTKTGAPILEGVAGYLDCELWAKYDAGDHIILVGEVVDMGGSEREPIVYDRGAFGK